MIAMLSIVGGVLLALSSALRMANGEALHWHVLSFLAAFGAFEASRTVLVSFLVNFFGDTQIYTTVDENAIFYPLREAMLNIVTTRLVEAVSDRANDGRPYDRIIIAAHSLGSTIAMDAIIRLHQLSEQGAITPEQFARIRAFVTFGSPMEKTKYFFDVVNPSPSLAYDQWSNDIYGCLFTSDTTVLTQENRAGIGIAWLNYWYFTDPIGGPIASYRSFLRPGDSIADASKHRSQPQDAAPLVCHNERGDRTASLIHPIIHGDFLDDPWFWKSAPNHIGALEIITH